LTFTDLDVFSSKVNLSQFDFAPMKALPPPESNSFERLFPDPAAIARIWSLAGHPVVLRINRLYRPWRAVRPMALAEGLEPLDVWRAVKFQRLSGRRSLPFPRHEGGSFGFTETPVMREQLHHIDQTLGGGGPAAMESRKGLISDRAVRTRFAIRSMMEEAIGSSRIEGAVTTRSDALNLLRSGRPPRTTHERMVTNNYAAIQNVKTWLDKDLTIDRLHHLQAILTQGTLEHADQAGRFRRATEPVRVEDDRTNEVIFIPPPAEGIADRVQTICDFANQHHRGDAFIHPIIKACVLHFMIGYEHPYCDGNGRTARAIFYWFALKHGYRVFEYMAISELIRKSYAKYALAYLNSELDEGDITYFIVYKLRVIMIAIERLEAHLEEEEGKIQRSLRLAASDPGINLRQRLLLDHAIRHPKTVYTVKSHATSNRISPGTARSDLDDLARRGLLNTFRVGRTVSYVLAPEAHERLGA
jgi:Fic family protein